jgi:cation:H+ antiporter
MPDIVANLSTFDLFIFGVCAIAVGMFFLVKGGDWIIDSAVYIAFHNGMSPIVVGFTIVAFGTSFPELIASMTASLKGSPEIAVGNVLGSNVANVLMVIGITALIVPLAIHRDKLFKDVIIMLIATAALAVLMMGDVISRWEGLALFAALLGYTYWKYMQARKGDILLDEVEAPQIKNMKLAVFYLALGLVVIAVGADFLIRGSVLTARLLGVPELIIGLSVIAIGTSLPELSTCIAAARKKHTDVVIGNIIGSNIFNILMIMGLCAAAQPFVMDQIAPRAVSLDLWITVAVTLLLSFWILAFKSIDRRAAIVLVILYVGYIVFQYNTISIEGML